jgi:HD-GYP domain-containing protein (c-di-GMP phosphodiesterase class II)
MDGCSRVYRSLGYPISFERSMLWGMWFKPDIDEQEVLADTYLQNDAGMTARDWLAEAIVGMGLVAATIGLFVLRTPGGFAVAPAVLSLVLLVLATNVRFDTPFGFTVATQLAFVPLLFAVPIAVVPISVVAAFALTSLPDVVRRKKHPSRLLLAVGNSWFAIGPVGVFAVAGVAPSSASLMLLLGALGAEFLVDFAISALRLWIARGADLSTQLRDTWVYAVDAALSGVGLAVAQDMHARSGIEIVIAPMLALLAIFARERRDRLQQLLELSNAYRGTALVLGDVVEADDAYTGEHSKGVVGLSLAVGQRLGLSAERRRNLEFGALLHDVGKIAIPKEIINKPGKLDPEEWTIIKTHTVEGQKLLDRVGGFMRDVGLIVRSHHERWDGGGYPDGLVGEAIPLEARIITCCDSWNAMRTDRTYRKALPIDVALAELKENSGVQFDPQIVSALVEIIEAQAERPLEASPAPRPNPALAPHTAPVTS